MTSDRDEDFNDWVLHYRDRLYRRAFLICGNAHQADDLVQETLMKVYPRWAKVTRGGDPLPYVRRVLVHACIDQGRRPWRRETPTEQMPEPVSITGEPDHQRLMGALQKMPPRQRAVLVLRYWDQLTIEETARATGTTVGTVKAQASRGLQVLRTALATIPELEP